MAFTFIKKNKYGSGNPQNPCPIYLSMYYRKNEREKREPVNLAVRLSQEVLQKLGWKLGTWVAIGFDSGQKLICLREVDGPERDGFKLTGTATKKGELGSSVVRIPILPHVTPLLARPLVVEKYRIYEDNSIVFSYKDAKLEKLHILGKDVAVNS